jgi:hypothetical protein
MLSRMISLSGRMNIARVNIGFFTGFKKIKQRRISFVLGMGVLQHHHALSYIWLYNMFEIYIVNVIIYSKV